MTSAFVKVDAKQDKLEKLILTKQKRTQLAGRQPVNLRSSQIEFEFYLNVMIVKY
jgi:hypothetical protein